MPRGDNPNSRKNLEKRQQFTVETAKKAGRKGAAVSNKVQAERKTLRDIVQGMLERPAVSKGQPLTSPDGQPLENYSAAIVAAMLYKALKGDVKAAEKIMEWGGEANAAAGITINVDLGK